MHWKKPRNIMRNLNHLFNTKLAIPRTMNQSIEALNTAVGRASAWGWGGGEGEDPRNSAPLEFPISAILCVLSEVKSACRL